METLEVISNKKRHWAKRVQWLRNVHDTPKNNLTSTAADTFGTPISNSVRKWTRSLRIFDFGAGDNPSQLFELCPLFQLTRVTFDPALPYLHSNMSMDYSVVNGLFLTMHAPPYAIRSYQTSCKCLPYVLFHPHWRKTTQVPLYDLPQMREPA